MDEDNIIPAQEGLSEVSKKLVEDDPLVRVVNKIITDGIDQRANDILIEPLDDELQVRFRIDGVLYKALSLPKTFQDSVITRLKVVSGLDISEHRLPQDGRFKISLKESEVNFRVSVIPASLGEKIALRVLDKTKVVLDINKLGLDARTLELLKRNLIKPFGMVLVCGPTGSGKTTTLYSALKYIDSVGKNIVTVEDPVEYQLYGINQVAVYEDIGLTFASVLRAILRQDPNIILVGEIRDFDTADISVKAALTGHLLLSTLHTISAPGALVRLVNMGIEPFLISSSCLMIASQVLARLLCPQCKEAYKPQNADIAEFRKNKMELDADAKLYKRKGCPVCNNTGFAGRTCIAESMEVTPSLRELINSNAAERQIRVAAQAEGMVSIWENGLGLVRAGLTDMEEVVRVASLD